MSGIELATAYVTLTVDGSQIPKDVDKHFRGIERQARDTGKRSGAGIADGMQGSMLGGVKGMASKVFAPLMAIGAAAKVGEAIGTFITGAVDEAREAQKVSAITNQIVKATGGASKITAKQVGDLAEAISRKTGVDDEAIQSSANLLLTFKQVRNEAGKGNDIFSRATAAAQDMAAAGFGDANSAAKMLGKALNDPLKGITALGRAGVTFTDGQKKQIKALVESGDTLKAQKIIMREVESQVGGTAAASATAGDKMRVAWGNFKEDVGTKLLPVLDKFANWFTTTGLPAVERFGGWITGSLWPALEKGWKTIFPGVQDALKTLGGALGGNGIEWKKVGDFITQKVVPVLATFIRYYLPMLAAQWRVVIEVLKAAWRAFTTGVGIVNSFVRFGLWAFGKFLDSAVAAFGWIPGIGDKLRAAKKKFDTFAAGVNAALARIDDQHVKVRVDLSTNKAYQSQRAGERAAYGKAYGGPIPGSSPHRRADNIPIMATAGEFMQPVDTVDFYGLDAMEAIRKKTATIITEGYARGGLIIDPEFPSAGAAYAAGRAGVQSIANANGAALYKKMLAAQTAASGGVGAPTTKGVHGWQKQWSWLHKAWPSAVLTSAYRPGAITSSGNRSYHSMGRAIDVTPSMGIFNLIKKAFGSSIKELIYSPAGGAQVKNGRNYFYTGAVRAQHFNHVHWAMADGGLVQPIKPALYDQGGILPPTPPGTFLPVQNRTGRDEYVTKAPPAQGMSDEQFQRLFRGMISELRQMGTAGLISLGGAR